MPITANHKNDNMAAEKAENQAIQAMGATFADESQATRLLALQIAQKGMKSALQPDGALQPFLHPTEPSHVKIYAEIAAKAGQWGGDNQITVNCQAYAGASVAPLNSESEETIIDLE